VDYTARDEIRASLKEAQDHRSAQIERGVPESVANHEYMDRVAVIEATAAEAGVAQEELEQIAGAYRISFHEYVEGGPVSEASSYLLRAGIFVEGA
jgi:hypothetical protein